MLRNEWKHWITWSTHQRLQAQLRVLLSSDSHGQEYHIRSVYFDTPQGDCSFEKYSGLEKRNKYRMRFYNHDDGVIKLEIKTRVGDKIRKTSAKIERQQADDLLRGRRLVNAPIEAKQFLSAVKNLALKPVIVVDYIREAYTYKHGNVRITFDKHLRSGLHRGNVFSDSLPMFPVHNHKALILEVKYNHFLPTMVHRLISPMVNGSTDISKYCLCRGLIFPQEELL